MKPAFVIYGNCQAAVLAEATRWIPSLVREFDVVYIQSFDHPVHGRSPIDPDVMGRCALLWEQLDERQPLSFDGRVREDRVRVTFPPLDFAPLWPFQTDDPVFSSEPPEFPFGRFPYGDRVLIDISQRDIPLAQVVDAYEKSTAQQLYDMDRLLELELRRLVRREAAATVSMAAFVIGRFRTTRLFWAFNHPTRYLFGELLRRLARATWPMATATGAACASEVDRVFSQWEPFDHFQVPVIHEVARNLDLMWWQAAFRYKCYDRLLSAPEYLHDYVSQRRTKLLART